MRSLFGLLVTFLVMLGFGSYAWNHMRHVPLVAPPAVGKGGNATPNFAEAQEAQKIVGFAGPLATYMAKQDGSPASQAGPEGAAQVETLESIPAKLDPSDHVGGSVVGSTKPILHKTFRVHAAVQLPFEVPAHAASPRLRGTYRSFVKQAGVQGSDADAEAQIEFLVLNEQQYAQFLNRHAGEATFDAEDAYAQEVNTSLPPTINQSAKYHLVFRNNSRGREAKFVQADFRMEF
jgi:hypothetical protein